jgi:transposase
MFKTQQGFTNSMFGSYAYDSVIARHQDHLLVKMNTLIDWSFVEEEVADCYAVKGQHAYPPALMFKLLVIQDLNDLSDRDTCEATDTNILYRYFVGLGLTEEVPHWTDLGKFKERIGMEAMERLFYRILEEAERLGIEISTKRNADTTDVKANVDLSRCAKDKQGKDDHSWIDRNTSDPEAGFGKKGNKPSSKRWYGYKSAVNQDTETELTTAVVTASAEETDESLLIPLVDQEREFRGEEAIGAQGGDKGFVGNTDALTDRDILDYVIPRDNMRKERVKKLHNTHYLHVKHQRYKVEQKIAEGKRWHRLRKAKYWGRLKVHLQCLFTYLTMNLKRIINLLTPTTAST